MNPWDPPQVHAQAHPTASATPDERKELHVPSGSPTSAIIKLVPLVLLWTLASSLFPIMATLLASALGVWFVLGRTNGLVRGLIALQAVWLLDLLVGRGDLIVALVICLGLSALGTTAAAIIVARVVNAPTRGARFAIWDLAGYTLFVGGGLVLTREWLLQLGPMWESGYFPWEGYLIMAVISGNTVLASLAMFVPKHHRQGGLEKLSVRLVWFVMPTVEAAFLFALGMVHDWTYLLVLPFAHLIGALLVGMLVFTLETAGAFRDDDRPGTTKTAPAESWEEAE